MPTMGREDGVVHALCCPSAKVPPTLLTSAQRAREVALNSAASSHILFKSAGSKGLEDLHLWFWFVWGFFSPVKVKGSFPAGSFLCNKVQLWKEPAPRWSSTCKHSWGAGHSTGRTGPIEEPAHPGAVECSQHIALPRHIQLPKKKRNKEKKKSAQFF